MLPAADIHPLTEAGVPFLAGWIAATPLWARYNLSADQAAALLRTGLTDGACILTCGPAEAPDGFVWVVTDGAFDRSGYIRWLGVRPGAQRAGLGSRLLSAAEAALGNRSQAVFLLVSDFNHEAQAFYQQHGYTQCGALPNYILPGVAELIFWKHTL
jgi:ribosomal protein S18 acetylase RimI-like enzyme